MNNIVRGTCFLLMITSTGVSAEYTNLGKISSKEMLEKYPTFEQSLHKAMVGIPGYLLASGEDFYGYYENLKSVKFKENTSAPTIVYMHGSGNTFSHSDGKPKLKWDYGYANWIVDADYIFIAPDAHSIEDRPTFSSPVAKSLYEEVHKIRQAEITQVVGSLLNQKFVNKDEMYLLGVSEGAFATARYAGNEFKGRMILSWSCEPGYFTDYPKVGANKKTPFLNIMGHKDFYFGKDAPYNTNYSKNTGNCANHLSMAGFVNARVITYPEIGHGVSYNQYMKTDLLSFLDYWVNKPIN
ncbi:hypothetical protein L0B53_12240 [Vibrio sp. SS-MA-C1-2]|uniref:hypothetical protein n=1 Tax=Vibrio sp. SS-MA-C1-2 TaxID=2908646 RepID=UPI001F2BC8C0|nr:hypothetical protein [Vibrio sp. SS-MA-C1-2]UJF17796.1 hypothetical protein L0B53_12240 [Vibrio sp. SS-MA-C1-2]